MSERLRRDLGRALVLRGNTREFGSMDPWKSARVRPQPARFRPRRAVIAILCAVLPARQLIGVEAGVGIGRLVLVGTGESAGPRSRTSLTGPQSAGGDDPM